MRRTLIAAVASSLATAAVIGGVAVAQSSKSTPPPTQKDALAQRQKATDDYLAKVAKRLGVDAGDLKKSVDDAEVAQLDQLVKDGKLTQAERDALIACKADPLKCDRSNLPAGGFGRGGFGGPRGPQGGPSGPTGARPTPPSAADMKKRMQELQQKMDDFFAAIGKPLGKSGDDVKKAFQAEGPVAFGFDEGYSFGFGGGPGFGGPGGHGFGPGGHPGGPWPGGKGPSGPMGPGGKNGPTGSKGFRRGHGGRFHGGPGGAPPFFGNDPGPQFGPNADPS